MGKTISIDGAQQNAASHPTVSSSVERGDSAPAGVDTMVYRDDTGLHLHGTGRDRKQSSAFKSPSMVRDASAADGWSLLIAS